MNNPKRYLVTAALPYANGPLHIGHLAGAYLTGDIYTRYLRLQGKDVVYICGSDEHGAAITIRAKKDGITPKEVIDRYDASFRDTFKKLGVDFDIFHRTSSELHHETAQDFFRTLNDKNVFKKETSEQYYDEAANQFLADRYIMGTCPKCGHEEAYGDQCEKCGSTLSPTELINPKSSITGATPILKSTTHWYLPLDEYEDWLREWIETGKLNGEQLHDPRTWKTHVLGQCKSWLNGGLQARAMTRDLEWGVDVPQEIEGAAGKKLYVWLDAPIGYISATKQWAKDNGKDWKDYWQDKDTELVHFIGKDNIVFHCIIFPSILKLHGDYILPKNVPANQFLNLEGKKLSTSRNWALWAHEYAENLDGKVVGHIDALRYSLIKLMPEQRDSEFTWKGYQEMYNNELVNNLANFINRIVVLTNKYYDGAVPAYDADLGITSAKDQLEGSYADAELLTLHDKIQELGVLIEGYNFRDALRCLLDISSLGNQFLQFNAPWKAQKTDPEMVKVVMNVGIQYVTALSVACRPFLPFTSDRMRDLLALPALTDKGELKTLLDNLAEGKDLLPAGHVISKPSHLFTKISDEVIEEQIQLLEESQPKEINYEPVKETISFDDFTKLDLRTGTIIEAAKIRKTKKLLKLSVDLGFETRTIVSGIAEYFKPEEVIGQKVVVLINLAPRTMKKVESAGMILMAEDENGALGFVNPKDGFGNGFVVK